MRLPKFLDNLIMHIIQGLLPEVFLVFVLMIFFCVLLFLRFYYKSNTTEVQLALNLNYSAWALLLPLLLSYWIFIYMGPAVFDMSYGIHSDSLIYAFRLVLTALFIVYWAYIYLSNSSHVFYTFEYYFMLVVGLLALNLMLISSNFLNLLLSMELYSMVVYYLIHEKRTRGRTTEAAFKYFTVSSYSTAFFVFGLFFVYLSSGATEFKALSFLATQNADKLMLIGYFFIVASLLIKVGAGVFFFWILDAYEGASFPVLIFLNIFVKPAFVFIIFKILLLGCGGLLLGPVKLFLFSTAIIGVVGASLQSKVKRFLIFTSMYNMGFLSFFFWEPNGFMLGGFVVFFGVYSLNSMCLMMLFGLLRDASKSDFVITDLKDLSCVLPQHFPLAFGLVFFLLSVSGLPPFSVFFVKYFLLVKIFNAFTAPYVLILLLCSVIALFCYIRIIRIIFEFSRPTFFVRFKSGVAAGILAFMTVFNIVFLFVAEDLLKMMQLFVLEC